VDSCFRSAWLIAASPQSMLHKSQHDQTPRSGITLAYWYLYTFSKSDVSSKTLLGFWVKS